MNPELAALLEAKAAESGKSLRECLLEMLGESVIAEEGDVAVTSDGAEVTATQDVDEPPPPPPPDPNQQYPGFIVVEAEGARDQDPVRVPGCPACLRGSPRRGALHNCGKSNGGLVDTPRYMGPAT